MSTLTLAHLGFVVKDMASGLKRFLREGADVRISPVQDSVQRVEVCLLEISGGVMVELVSPLPGVECPIAARLQRGGGLDHICYYASDIHRAITDEQTNGAILLSGPQPALAFNTDAAFVYRKCGLVVEFLSRPEE